eukprot:COSAG05_NODE_249_length_12903_cov_128.635505_3_plen_53_part_00
MGLILVVAGIALWVWVGMHCHCPHQGLITVALTLEGGCRMETPVTREWDAIR